jgi:hypothetical protein
MLNTLPTPILLDIAILFTALSWGLSLSLVGNKVYIFVPLAIGCFVCLFGYSVESLGARLGCGGCPRSLGSPAALVSLKKAEKNGSGLRADLGI